MGEGSRGVNCHGRWPASHAGRGGRLVLCAALPRSRRASSRARMADGGTGRPAGNFSRPVRVAAGQPGRLVAEGAARERLPSASTRRVSCSLDLDALARLLALCWLWRPIDQTAFNALNRRRPVLSLVLLHPHPMQVHGRCNHTHVAKLSKCFGRKLSCSNISKAATREYSALLTQFSPRHIQDLDDDSS